MSENSGAEELQPRFSNASNGNVLRIPLNSQTSPEKSYDDFVSEDVSVHQFRTNLTDNLRKLVIK